MNTISEHTVRSVLSKNNFSIQKLENVAGGSNHLVFAVKTTDGKKLIVKFPTVRKMESSFCKEHTDTLFGGKLSLEREAYLFDLVRRSGLPSPRVLGILPTKHGDCIIVERSPGCNLMDYMQNHNHSLHRFLQIIENLGNDFRVLHKTTFKSFGNIMKDSVIEPSGILNFADRYMSINQMILNKCKSKGGLDAKELERTQKFFDTKFKLFRDKLDIFHSPATLVITDMHGNNFFVKNDKISGYFDVESSQAAPLEFELYAIRFFVCNYYGEKEYVLAEKAFWHAYYHGQSDHPDKKTDELIDFFSACRLLEIFQSYWGHIDGVRDTWGQRIKILLFNYMNTSKIDYASLGAIWRERDRQPVHART